MSEPVQNRVREIVANVTLNPPEKVGPDAAAGTLQGWDSLAQVNIVLAVESEFGVTFEADQVHSLNSVAAIAGALDRAGT